MSDEQGIPAAPSERDLPDHRRMREELLMKIGFEEHRPPSRSRRWGVPLAVATGVTVVSVTAVAVLGGTGEARPSAAPSLSAPAAAPASPSASAPGAGAASPSAKAAASASADPNDFTITAGKLPPIGAGSVARILSSCLGQDAARFHSVLAVRTPVAAPSADGVVIAVNSAGQYAQCQTKGDKGSSMSSPPTFINDRLWSDDRSIEYFDSTMEPTGKRTFLVSGAGHYASGVAKVTISYGDKPAEYPALMADGAFFYASTLTAGTVPDRRYAGPSPYVHAYDASGKEIYDQRKDPRFR
ncbi:hypothetical protein ABII15_13740 [Streptomyces sp. HUAS MG91]|uniref:Uncharacterized protein n=1 Tax=Streptomyces tabacisoli TaxID=3156398 RepID=A0AAU8ISC5_9ACTN